MPQELTGSGELLGGGRVRPGLAVFAPGKQEMLDLAGGQRLAQQEALHLGAALGADRVELRHVLDAFRSRRNAEAVGQRRHRAHDIERAALSAMFFTNERSILILSKGKLCRLLSEE